MTMKIYSIEYIYRGIQSPHLVFAKTKKEACEAFGCSLFYLNKWASNPNVNNGKFKELLENPNEIFVSFWRSGQTPFFVPKELFDVPIKKESAYQMIDAYRKQFPTYQDANKHFGIE